MVFVLGTAGVAAAAVSLLVFGGVAGATPTEITSLPWGGTPSPAYAADGFASPAPEGQCNLKEILPDPGGDGNWGISIGCQAAVPTDTWADISNHEWIPDIDVPGASCGSGPFAEGGVCGDDPQGFWNTGNLQDGGSYNIGAYGESPAGHCVYFDYVSGSGPIESSSSGDSCDPGEALADGGVCSSFTTGQCTYGNAIAMVCRYNSATLGSTGTLFDSITYYPLQFQVDCEFYNQGGNTEVNSSGSTLADCDFSDAAADASFNGSSGETDMTVDDTCVSSAGDTEAAVPDHYWVGGSPSQTGGADCQLGTITTSDGGTGTSLDEQANHTYSYTITYSGDASYILADPGDYGEADFTTQDVGIYTYSLAPDTTIASVTGSPQTVTITPQKSGTYEPNFYCVDSDGNIYRWGELGGVGSVGGDNGEGGSQDTTCNAAGCWVNLGTCIDGSDLGLDPSSWEPGLISDIGCLFSWAFIPVSVNTSSLSSPFTENFPGTWIVQVTDALGVVEDGVTGSLSSPCDAPHIGMTELGLDVQLPAPASLGCGETEANINTGELYGWRQFGLDIETFLVWMVAVFTVWRMMPWVKSEADEPPLGLGTMTGEFVTTGGQSAYTYTVGDE
jgi:hypothetical protein